jgi:hypothetical protein
MRAVLKRIDPTAKQRPGLMQTTLLSELLPPLLLGLGTIVQPPPVLSSIKAWLAPLLVS